MFSPTAHFLCSLEDHRIWYHHTDVKCSEQGGGGYIEPYFISVTEECLCSGELWIRHMWVLSPPSLYVREWQCWQAPTLKAFLLKKCNCMFVGESVGVCVQHPQCPHQCLFLQAHVCVLPTVFSLFSCTCRYKSSPQWENYLHFNRLMTPLCWVSSVTKVMRSMEKWENEDDSDVLPLLDCVILLALWFDHIASSTVQ